MRSAFCLVILGFVVFAQVQSPGSASASLQAKSGPTDIQKCDVGAYVIDHDPQGLNVRSGPGKNFNVIGNLPYREDTGVGVHITGSSGDWVQIDLGFEEGTEEERTLFKGVGWVYGPLLGLAGIAHPGGGTPLYQEASLRSRVIKRVPGDDDVIVRGCRGGWFFVEYKKMKGWAAPRTLCNNPLTTCA